QQAAQLRIERVNVRTKLRGAFAVYIALLAGLSLYHVRTTRRAVESAQQLSDIASRLRSTSTVLLGRLSEIGDNAQKVLVTHDTGYFEKTQQAIREYDGELRRIDSLQLSARERALVIPLMHAWSTASDIGRAIPIKTTKAQADSIRTELNE